VSAFQLTGINIRSAAAAEAKDNNRENVRQSAVSSEMHTHRVWQVLRSVVVETGWLTWKRGKAATKRASRSASSRPPAERC